MCDSTNAERQGFTPSEKKLGPVFDMLFEEHKKTRIIIATFASNVDRVQQIINTADKFGRKVVVEGRSMVNIIETASNLNRISIPENTVIDIERLKNYPKDKTVIITTGKSGGEHGGAQPDGERDAQEDFDWKGRHRDLFVQSDSGQ